MVAYDSSVKEKKRTEEQRTERNSRRIEENRRIETGEADISRSVTGGREDTLTN